MKSLLLFALAILVLPVAGHAQSHAETRLSHISIQSIGEGDPVVLIPGLASPRAVWDGIAPDLARRHRVLLVQVNGFAGDDRGANGAEGMLPAIVGELAGYLRDNGIERPAIVGHSLGGLLGMMLAKDHPEQVGRLMVVDALPFFGMLMGPASTVETVRPMAANMRDMMRNAPSGQSAPPNMSNNPAGQAQVATWANAADRMAASQALYEDFVTDLRPDVAAIGRVPLTVVYAVPNAGMAEMVHGLYRAAYADDTDARLVPIEDSFHFVMLDQPARFTAALETFLAGR